MFLRLAAFSPVRIRTLVGALVLLVCAVRAYAGGSGLNTVVVVNQASSNSVEVGNYYCERRQVPVENVLRINWAGGNISWTNSDFESVLLTPLLKLISDQQLTHQIEYVVLSMDIPFQTVYAGTINGTTSALFYGAKTETGPDWVGITNSYSGSEKAFALAKPASSPGYSFLATMVTAGTVSQAKRLIDQGVASDGTFPWQPVYLEKTSDPLRNFRYWFFDNAIFNAALCRPYSYTLTRTNCDSPWGQTNLLGIQTGLYQFSLSPNTFIPGAMADSLTSYGGIIFGPNDHTTLMSFINSGASGSYGTVTEPSAVPGKFPDPQAYFYQARGFSVAECYYQSLFEPYEGLVVAEPLAAPFRRAARGAWIRPKPNTLLSGVQPISIKWIANDSAHPLQQIDLFVDNRFFRTITNIGPRLGDGISVKLNGYPVSCSVPSGAGLGDIASLLAAAINNSAVSNLSLPTAYPYGDRIELHAPTDQPSPFFYVDPPSANRPVRFYRTMLLPANTPPSLVSLGRSPSGAYRFHVESLGNEVLTIQASTNLMDWVTLAENLFGPVDFSDYKAAQLPQRFYRVGYSTPLPSPPTLRVAQSVPGEIRLQGNAGKGGCVIEASTDLHQWAPIATNSGPGMYDFVDSNAASFPHRFYRASAFVPAPQAPQPGVVGLTSDGSSLVQINPSSSPYVLQVSSDLIHWTTVFSNTYPSEFQVSVTTSPIPANPPNTSLTVSRGTFLRSPAQGIHRISVSGSMNVGSWMQLVVTKTNGAPVRVGVTNQSVSATIMDVEQTLVSAINSCPDLQGPDGLQASDLTPGWFGAGSFNLRASSPGLQASAIRVSLSSSFTLFPDPASEVTLNQNLSDLLPRNHLYLSSGTTNLTVSYPLDTTQLSDGFHELTAVVYEGTSARTQTRLSLPVTVTNSPLSANLVLLDFPPTNAPATGTYQLRVNASTNNVKAIRLLTTGGVLDVVSNQPAAIFTVNGSFLGPGLHPFWAIVETTDGRSYRTPRQFARFVNP